MVGILNESIYDKKYIVFYKKKQIFVLTLEVRDHHFINEEKMLSEPEIRDRLLIQSNDRVRNLEMKVNLRGTLESIKVSINAMDSESLRMTEGSISY